MFCGEFHEAETFREQNDKAVVFACANLNVILSSRRRRGARNRGGPVCFRSLGSNSDQRDFPA